MKKFIYKNMKGLQIKHLYIGTLSHTKYVLNVGKSSPREFTLLFTSTVVPLSTLKWFFECLDMTATLNRNFIEKYYFY